MGAVWLRFSSELRSRWRSWVALAVLIALSAGAVLTLAAGARRTDSAYERLAAASNAHDILVIAQAFDLDLDAVARLPEVADSARLAYVLMSVIPGEPLELTPLVSVDGGFLGRIDRPKVLKGRRPHPERAHEIAITPAVAEQRGLKVGSTLTAQGYAWEQFEEIFGQGTVPPPRGPVMTLEVVGIEVSTNEGELVSSSTSEENIHLTPAFARTYGDSIAMGNAMVVRLERGSADLAAFRAGVERIAAGRPTQLSSQTDEARKVQRSIHLQALALALLAALAALAAALTTTQALARHTFLLADDYPALRAMGMTRKQLWTTAMLRTGAIGVVGATGAVAVAVAASPLMPLALARLAEPSPGLSVDGLVLGSGLVVVPVLLLLGTALPAWRGTRGGAPDRSEPDAAGPTRLAERLARGGLPPSTVIGVRLAVEPGRGATAVPTRSAILATALSLAALTTALTFGASLDRLFSTPRLYGWNWDLTVGNAYLPELADRVVPVLRQSPLVGAFSAVTTAEVDVADVHTQAVGFETLQGSVVPPIVQGREPIQPHEVVLGAETLRSANREVGDLVEVRVGDAVRTVRIVGKAVFPVLGLFDVGGLGDGALFTAEGLRWFLPDAPQNIFPIVVAPGVDRERTVASLAKEFEEIDPALGAPPIEVADFGRVDEMPSIISGVLALAAAATIAHALVSTVRRRARDLAVLKVLGFVRRQVWTTVEWQATTMIALAAALGLPVGVAAGRLTWYVFADELGIVPEPVVPVVAVLLVVPAALAAGHLVAAVPAWAAGRTRPAQALRTG